VTSKPKSTPCPTVRAMLRIFPQQPSRFMCRHGKCELGNTRRAHQTPHLGRRCRPPRSFSGGAVSFRILCPSPSGKCTELEGRRHSRRPGMEIRRQRQRQRPQSPIHMVLLNLRVHQMMHQPDRINPSTRAYERLWGNTYPIDDSYKCPSNAWQKVKALVSRKA
jgi:hypothetical protein